MWIDRDAVPFLMQRGLDRADARELLKAGEGTRWRTEELRGQRGKPKALRTLAIPDRRELLTELAAAETLPSETPQLERRNSTPIPADRMDTGRRKSGDEIAAKNAGIREGALFPPPPRGTASSGHVVREPVVIRQPVTRTPVAREPLPR
jgi:hypothetical protein